MAGQRPRVLVVEDDDPIRDALAATLRGEGYEVEALPDGREVRRAAAVFGPDLAILDVHLPVGPNGHQIAHLLRCDTDIPLLFLTAADGVDERVAGFAAGADDYLVKPFAMEELLARIRALLRRTNRLISAVQQVGDLILDEAARRVSRGGVAIELTRREHDILTVLVRHRGRVLSKEQLLANVWGFEAYDPNLVEVHVSSLRRKLEAHGPRLVHTVRGTGYVLRA